ncbi:MAG: alpha/beta fold hydrolase [Saprospiraceae bacterium]|nr:alpha/beta fold hydrolase [Saprospiraceae bacterium]
MRTILYSFGIFMLLINIGCALPKSPSVSRMSDLSYPFDTHYLELSDGVRVAYADEGKGDQTILFVHGLGSYYPAWKKNVAALSKKYRCVAIDLPGYGKSSKENYSGSMRFYAGIVKEVCDKLGVQKVSLAGHSMGGQISLVAALTYPELVEKLILVAPAGFETFNKGEKEWFRQVMTADGVRITTAEQIRTNLAYNFYNMSDDARFMIDDRLAMRTASDFPGYCYIIPQSVRGMVDEPVYDYLPLVKQPALVIFGENDNLIPNRYLHGGPTRKVAESGTARMPAAQLKMIPKAGHFVMFEQAETVNQLVADFLR